MSESGDLESELAEGLYTARNLVDIDRFKQIFQRFTDATGFAVGLLSYPEMDVLISTGWQSVCSNYHITASDAAINCLRSNSSLMYSSGGTAVTVLKECSYGLLDCGIPIEVEGKHIASLFTGQVFTEEPDRAGFQRQAETYGFDSASYINAIEEIPVVSREVLTKVAEFLMEMAGMISEQGLRNLKMIRKTANLREEIIRRGAVEECLRRSEEKYRFLAEKMADIVWTIDLDFNTTYITPSVKRVLGFTPEERSRQTPEEMIVPESLEKIRKIFADEMKRSIEKPEEIFSTVVVEAEYYHRDGSTVWLENTMKAIRNNANEIVGIYGVSRDISQRKKAEKEKKKLQDQLVVAQKMESLGRLAGGIAHDFNNLLTVIIGNTELAMKALEPSNGLRNTLLQIHHAAEDSAALTRQLLAFARKQVIQPKMLNINGAVSGMFNMLHRLIGEQIKLQWKPSPGLWASMIDPNQLDQILINLCVNARDAIDGVGRITIVSGNTVVDDEFCCSHQGISPGEYVTLAVKDSGKGIEKSIMSHIFEPFFTTKGIGKGTGLGLATVYGIVKQNGGYVDVQSELNCGTEVTVYLPGSSTEAVEEQHSEAGEIPIGHRETVLLVEDEKTVLDMIVSMLEGLDYNVVAAGFPEEALKIVREYHGDIHLLFTDLVMPEMNGRELAEEVLRLRPSMKYLFMSGYTADVTITSDFAENGLHFVQKPFSMRTVAVKINEVLKEN